MPLVRGPLAYRAASTVVFVGRNSRGNWVAREQNGIFGGLFVSRAQAFKYAMFENGNRPEAILEVLREIELDIPASPYAPVTTRPNEVPRGNFPESNAELSRAPPATSSRQTSFAFTEHSSVWIG